MFLSATCAGIMTPSPSALASRRHGLLGVHLHLSTVHHILPFSRADAPPERTWRSYDGIADIRRAGLYPSAHASSAEPTRPRSFVNCFALDYQSEQPLHPNVGFEGREQVRKNWTTIFKAMPDFHSELLSSAVSGDTVWAEWRWQGVRVDGHRMEMRGVTILGVQNNSISWARLYMEPVQATDADIDAQIQQRTQG